jgi:hypothetical protein
LYGLLEGIRHEAGMGGAADPAHDIAMLDNSRYRSFARLLRFCYNPSAGFYSSQHSNGEARPSYSRHGLSPILFGP